jgi:DNA polymerase bacteriophage-type
MICHVDIETYSELDLVKCGVTAYANHPSTRILMIAIDYDGEQWVDEMLDNRMEKRTRQVLSDNTIMKAAWNAPFERRLISVVGGIDCPPKSWQCTQAHALYLGLPASLEMAGNALKIGGDNAKAVYGKKLMRLFSFPKGGGTRESHPEEWKQYCDYCAQDVKAEKTIAALLNKVLCFPQAERELWIVDQRINDRGVPVDVDFIDNAIAIDGKLRDQSKIRMQELTAAENPNSRNQILEWLRKNQIETEGLTKTDVRDLLKTVEDPVVREVLEIRLNLSRSASSKFEAMRKWQHDGVVCNSMQYSGASRTHRWAGRGVQFQNMARGFKDEDQIDNVVATVKSGDPEFMEMMYDDPISVLSDAVRLGICAPPGKVFVVADYASIEVVMLAWVSKNAPALEDIKAGRDPYKVLAASMFNTTYDAVTKDQRTAAKPVLLGCGYGLGPKGLVKYATGYGLDLDEATAAVYVRLYRDTNPAVPRLWNAINDELAVQLYERDGSWGMPKQSIDLAPYSMKWDLRTKAAILKLPSDRHLVYWDAVRIQNNSANQTKYSQPGQTAYNGVNQFTKKWEQQTTWGGKLVENLVQSISRDVLAHGLINACKLRLDVAFHVHDEIVCLADEGKADMVLRQLQGAMVAPSWCSDAPVKTEAYVTKRYRKD